MIVVSDTSVVSNLWVIGQLELLPRLFGGVVIPSSVLAELKKLENYGYDTAIFETAPWITVRVPENLTKVVQLRNHLDEGESEAIVLAQELDADFLLIDERRGWKIAQAAGLHTMGTLGVLIQAKHLGVIPAVEPMLALLAEKAGFWMSERLRSHVLQMAGE